VSCSVALLGHRYLARRHRSSARRDRGVGRPQRQELRKASVDGVVTATSPGNLEVLRQRATGHTVSDMTGLTQPWHIILILLIALMLFGGRRLPEIGRSLGTGMREFKDSITAHTPAEPSPQLAPPEATAPAPQPTERETA
jgi:sec-independent protein translocase protein TatA